MQSYLEIAFFSFLITFDDQIVWGSGVKMTNQQLVAVGNLFAPGAGKTDSPLTSPCCRRQRHRHRHHCRPSLGMPSHELSIITQIYKGGVAALIVVASLMMYNTHLPSILYYMAQKKQHFVHAKSGKSCPHCLPYHIKIIFFIFVNINLRKRIDGVKKDVAAAGLYLSNWCSVVLLLQKEQGRLPTLNQLPEALLKSCN